MRNNKRRQFILRFILLILFCMVIEGIVFNYPAWSTRNLEPDEINISRNLSDKANEIIIDNIETEVSTVYASFIGSPCIMNVQAWITDDASRDEFVLCDKTWINPGNKNYHDVILRVKSNGRIRALKLVWDQKKQTLEDLEINNPVPFMFNPVRFLLILLICFAVISIRQLLIDRRQNISNYSRIILVVLLLGVILKIYYVQHVPYNISHHDLGLPGEWINMDPMRSLKYNGHIGYIQFIYKFHRFPNSYKNQMYHPPLFHIFGAIVIGISRHFGHDYVSALECLQFCNMMISCVSILFIYLTMKHLKITRLPLVVSTILVSFHPVFYNIGAALNNDALATAFGIAAIFFTIIWFFDNKTYQMVLIALSIGLGMFTKLSVVLVAPGIGLIFLYKLVYCINKNAHSDIKNYSLLWQLLLFAVICLPIGLFWSFHNMINFGLPINYVYRLPEGLGQFIGKVPLSKRIGLPSAEQMIAVRMNYNPETEANIWGQTFISSAFDEKILHNEQGFARWASILFLWINMLLGVTTNIIAVYGMKKSEKQKVLKFFLFTVYCTISIFYMKFCFDYPFICTMNFRYLCVAYGVLTILFALGNDIRIIQRYKLFRYLVNISNSIIVLWAILGSALYFLFY